MLNAKQKFSQALVTGASSGIGAAFCRLLATHGISLLMVARDQSRLDALAQELGEHVPVQALSADLSTQEGYRKVVEIIGTMAPDLVVNCAGFGLYGDVLTHPTERYQEMVDLNIKALLGISLEAATVLQARGMQGTILNVSSASDFIVFPGFAVYAATKAFVSQFSQSLDAELKSTGIRVLVSCPGVVRTEFRERASGRKRTGDDPASMDVDYAARQLWDQVTKGKTIQYFDFRTRVLVALARFLLPRSLVSKALFKKMRSLKDPSIR